MSYDHSLVKPLFVAANLVLYKLNESFDEFMRLLVYVMILLHTKTWVLSSSFSIVLKRWMCDISSAKVVYNWAFWWNGNVNNLWVLLKYFYFVYASAEQNKILK